MERIQTDCIHDVICVLHHVQLWYLVKTEVLKSSAFFSAIRKSSLITNTITKSSNSIELSTSSYIQEPLFTTLYWSILYASQFTPQNMI